MICGINSVKSKHYEWEVVKISIQKGRRKKLRKNERGKIWRKKREYLSETDKKIITTIGNDWRNTQIMGCSKVELFTPVTVFLDTSYDEHQSRENSLEGHNVKEKNNGKKRNKSIKVKEKNWLLHIC